MIQVAYTLPNRGQAHILIEMCLTIMGN